MKTKNSLQSIGRIHIGQILRITKQCNDVTEGVLNCIRRVEGGVMLKIGSKEFFIGVSPLGPLLNHHWGRVEILASQPDQLTLSGMKGGA